MAINQAVLFTKPMGHTECGLEPSDLRDRVIDYLEAYNFYIRTHRNVTSEALEAHHIMDQHYRIYSHAVRVNSMDELSLSLDAQALFKDHFKTDWHAEIKDKRIMPVAELLREKEITSTDLGNYWEELNTQKAVVKVQSGLLMGYVATLDAYIINGFYPKMVDQFHAQDYTMDYFVIEFDTQVCDWQRFRQEILGKTNCAQAASTSLRAQLHRAFPQQRPGSDNFVHGSAGPLEGFIERIVHEGTPSLATSPVGVYLMQRGIELAQFTKWLERQSTVELAALFDLTEEINTDQLSQFLDHIDMR